MSVMVSALLICACARLLEYCVSVVCADEQNRHSLTQQGTVLGRQLVGKGGSNLDRASLLAPSEGLCQTDFKLQCCRTFLDATNKNQPR